MLSSAQLGEDRPHCERYCEEDHCNEHIVVGVLIDVDAIEQRRRFLANQREQSLMLIAKDEAEAKQIAASLAGEVGHATTGGK